MDGQITGIAEQKNGFRYVSLDISSRMNKLDL